MELFFTLLILGIAFLLFLALFDEKASKRQTYAPNLIDLVKYEKELLYAREHATKPVPIRPWPSRKWSESELQHMRDNRAAAQTIKDRIFPKERTNDN